MKKTDDKTLIESMRRKAAELIATDSITSSVELILLADDFDRCADRLEELTKENADLKEKLDLCSKWQPMDTAPKDGEMFIKTELGETFCACKEGNRFIADDPRGGGGYFIHSEPIAWLPLPEGTEGL